MGPITSTDRQKLLLQQEIAKLSGAISRQAAVPSHSASYHPYVRGHQISRGQSTIRGRGRGRGSKTYGLDLRAANETFSPASSSLTKLVPPSLQAAQAEEKEAGELSPPPVTADENISMAKRKEAEDAWVKKTSKGGNMSLMTVDKSNFLSSLPPRPRRARPPKITPLIQVLSSVATSTPGGGEGKRVVIDGVIFQFEQGGKKLARIGELSPTAGTSGPRAPTAFETPTRKSLKYGGQKFRRTNRGNLVSSASRSELAKTPCRYYTKTGRCNRALTCPYAHIPDRLAICSRFLRSTCQNDASSCPLSHVPSAHNTPSCVHFQATSSCRNGPTCLYPHVRVSDDAAVCEAFAREEWCEREEGTCPELHVWECGEWRARGTCSRGGRCGLRHVLRAETGKSSITEAEAKRMDGDQGMEGRRVPVEGGFEDGAEFIEFGQGSAGAVSSEAEDGDGSEEGPTGEESDGSEDSNAGENEETEDEESVDPAVFKAEAKEPDHGEQRVSPSPFSRAATSPHPDIPMDTDEADEDEVLGVVF